jgi:hypothetical protein
MSEKKDFEIPSIFQMQVVPSIDQKKPIFSENPKMGTPSASGFEESALEAKDLKSELKEKWTIAVKPSYKHAIKVFAVKNNRQINSVFEEMFNEYLKNHNIEVEMRYI